MVIPDWIGETVVIAATGPSLCEYDLLYVRNKAKTIVINDAYRLAPFADVLFASDAKWWRHHKYVHEFQGQRWSHDHNGSTWPQEAKENGIKLIQGKNMNGLSRDPRFIHFGANSGFQAINLAVHCRVKRIILLGFDCMQHSGKSHFFGSHPTHLERNSPYAMFRQHFNQAAIDLVGMGVDVINCTRITSIRCFEQRPLRQVL